MASAKVDEQGYRLGVGMIILNADNRVFLGCRADAPDAWQFPQGGIHTGEEVEAAMYRELEEEVGLARDQVAIVGQTEQWYAYQLPTAFQLVDGRSVIGQRQRWYLLRLLSADNAINLGHGSYAEFCRWRWAEYWEPVELIIAFKRSVYQQVLTEFAAYLKK